MSTSRLTKSSITSRPTLIIYRIRWSNCFLKSRRHSNAISYFCNANAPNAIRLRGLPLRTRFVSSFSPSQSRCWDLPPKWKKWLPIACCTCVFLDRPTCWAPGWCHPGWGRIFVQTWLWWAYTRTDAWLEWRVANYKGVVQKESAGATLYESVLFSRYTWV